MLVLGSHSVTLPNVVSTEDLTLIYLKDETISFGDVSVVLMLFFLVRGSNEVGFLNEVGS